MKKLIAMLLALTMVLSLAACGAKEEAPVTTEAPAAEAPVAEAPAETEAAEPAAEPVHLRLAYMPNYASLWAVVTANEKGYFAEENITVELIQFENGPTEIAAMESGNIDISYIGPGAHKLCSTGNAQIILLQQQGDSDCVIGLKGIKTIEELKGKKVGYAAGTSSETILLTALESVGMTLDDIEAMSMDASAMTTAALSGSVDAVAPWSPFSLTILAEAENATDICSNADFPSLASPASWVVNPKWAAENHDVMVRFVRALYKGMDYAAAAYTDDDILAEVAGYIADLIAVDIDTVTAQRYDAPWLTSADVLEALESGALAECYENQKQNFITNGVVDAATALDVSEFLLSDIMAEAAK